MTEQNEVKNVFDLKGLAKEKEVLPGFKVKLKTLTYGEQIDLFKLLEDLPQNSEDKPKVSLYRDHTYLLNSLKYSLVSANDNVFDTVQKAEEFLKSLPIEVIVEINAFYNELLSEHDKKIEAIKKK